MVLNSNWRRRQLRIKCFFLCFHNNHLLSASLKAIRGQHRIKPPNLYGTYLRVGAFFFFGAEQKFVEKMCYIVYNNKK